MNGIDKVDAAAVRQLTVLNGLDLSVERAADLRDLRLGLLEAHRTGAEMKAAVLETFEGTCRVLEEAGA